MDSLEGKLPPNTTVNSFKEIQSLHRIQVLCPDKDLTKDNFCDMFLCDCKGYFREVRCSHIFALADWCVHNVVCALLCA